MKDIHLPSMQLRNWGSIFIGFKTVYFNQIIEVLNGGHVAYQEQLNIIPMGQNVHSNAKHFHCSCHATWPPCKTSIGIVCNTTTPAPPSK